MTVIELRTIRQYPANSHGLRYVCAACGGSWQPHLRRIVERLGVGAMPHEALGRLRCPHCETGRAGYYHVLILPPRQRIIWFGGAYDDTDW